MICQVFFTLPNICQAPYCERTLLDFETILPNRDCLAKVVSKKKKIKMCLKNGLDKQFTMDSDCGFIGEKD